MAPKGIVLAGDTQSTGVKPTRALKDDVVYEAHVRGLTMNDAGISAAYRGTYKGAGLKAAWLAGLGVTAIEFLPVQETQNDTNDNDPNGNAGDNYWGYMTLNYFAPDRRYAYDKTPGGPTREFKEMVKAFHDSCARSRTSWAAPRSRPDRWRRALPAERPVWRRWPQTPTTWIPRPIGWAGPARRTRATSRRSRKR